MFIIADIVYGVLSCRNYMSLLFITSFCRTTSAQSGIQAVIAREGGVNAVNTDWTNLYDLNDSQSRPASPPKISRSFPEKDEDSKKDGRQALENRDGLKLLPFEFVALEACLETVSSCLDKEDHLFGVSNAPGRDSHGTRTSTTHSAISKQLDVEELEMLVEAYFVQIVGTLNKLSTLRDYVDDTEDYINIMLDDKQNHLLQMGVVLTTATLVMNAFIVVSGVFGMNIHIDLFDPDKHGDKEFIWTVFGSTPGSIFLYVAAVGWFKHKRLLE